MAKIEKDMNVQKLLDTYPETQDVLFRYFKPLANPVLRAAMARLVTLEQAAKMHRLDLDQLLRDLNAAARE